MQTKTAAIDNYLIERVRGKVNLCENQGGQWITIKKNIDTRTAEYMGFNLESPAVREVFGMK